MRVLVLTDIFGATPELASQASRFACAPVMLAPYPEFQAYSDEEEAYTAFQRAGGLDAYVDRVKEALENSRFDACIGFSAGASAAWRASCGEVDNFPPALLFYGSRIRDYATLRPCVAVELIFAEIETSFEVEPLAAHLSQAGQLVSVWRGTKHGFMNPRSEAFDTRSMERGLAAITQFLAHVQSPPSRQA